MDAKKNPNDIALDKAAFRSWLLEGSGDNIQDIQRAKKAIHIILNEYMTECQRQYILCFFVEGMSATQIAELYGVDKSTVSRTIRRGIKTMYSYLRFTSLALMEVPMNEFRLCKRVRQ